MFRLLRSLLPAGPLPKFAWGEGDLRLPVESAPAASDPWAVVAEQTARAVEQAGERPASAASTEGWRESLLLDGLGVAEAPPSPEDAGWELLLGLPRFDRQARDRSFVEPPAAVDRTASRAAKRARWLVDLLGVAEKRRRDRYAAFFDEVFRDHPHVATFKALSGLAMEDAVTADLLVEACRFRAHFLSRPDWWMLRRRAHFASESREAAFFVPADGDPLMGWARALRLCRCAGGDPAPVVDERWLAEWQDLPAGDPCRWRFVDYLHDRLEWHGAVGWDPPAVDRRLDRTAEWKRGHSLPAASPFGRTAALLGTAGPNVAGLARS